MCICALGGCLDKYISATTWAPQQKFLAPPVDSMCIKIVNVCINNYSSKNCFNILLKIQ